MHPKYTPNTLQKKIHDEPHPVKHIVSNIATGSTIGAIMDLKLTADENPGQVAMIICRDYVVRSFYREIILDWFTPEGEQPRGHGLPLDRAFDLGGVRWRLGNAEDLDSCDFCGVFLADDQIINIPDLLKRMKSRNVKRPVILTDTSYPYGKIITCSPDVNEENLPAGYFDDMPPTFYRK